MLKNRGLPATLRNYGTFPTKESNSSHRKLGGRMTIGIGAVAHSGKCFLMASDTRGSYGSTSGLSPHDSMGKQFDLPFRLCAQIAGDVPVCSVMVSKLHMQFENLEKKPDLLIGDIQKAIRLVQVSELLYRFDDALVRTLGITLEKWETLEHSRMMYRAGRKVINKTILEAHLLVGGFLNGNLMFYSMYLNNAPGMETSHATIGSGSMAALEVLNVRQQHPHCSAQRALVHIAEALDAARAAHPDDIGEPSDYVLITPKASWRVPSSFASQLAARYKGNNTRPLDDDWDTFNDLRAAMYQTGISEREYAAGKRVLGNTKPLASQTSIRAQLPYGEGYPKKDHFSFGD